LRNSKKYNSYTKSWNTKKIVFLKYLATKTIESKKLPFYCITQNTGGHVLFKTVRVAVNINY